MTQYHIREQETSLFEQRVEEGEMVKPSLPGLEKMLPVEIHVRATVEHRHHAVQVRRAGAEGD